MKPSDQSLVKIEFSDKGQSSKSLQLCDDGEKLGDGDGNGNGNGNGNENENGCCVLESKVIEVDLEAGVVVNLDNKKEFGDECSGICRICHFSYDSTIQELGVPMELGCSCKGDLATAHKQCAEAWFKIRGNKTCEICGSTASNVTCVYAVNSEQSPAQEASAAATRMVHFHAATAVLPPAMSSNFWEDHRLLNILLAVMVLAFVISWLFHFKAPKLS